jgi:ankyrin repeat protein
MGREDEHAQRLHLRKLPPDDREIFRGIGADDASVLMGRIALRLPTQTQLDGLLGAAAGWKASSCVSALLEAGADPLAKDHHDMTALMHAAVGGSAPCVQALLGKSDASARDRVDRRDALMLAAQHGHLAATRLLIPISDPLAKDAFGSSALMLAASMGHGTCAELLAPVSDVSATDDWQETAAMSARALGCLTIAAMLDSYAERQAINAAMVRHLPAPRRRRPSL